MRASPGLKEETFLRQLPRKTPGAKRAVLCYPGPYGVGMSSLGFQTVFWELSKLPGLVCHRAFAASTGTAGRSLEDGSRLSSFDLVAFSLPFEPDYLVALEMLKASGIPLYREQRNQGYPLIIAGGVAVSGNPAPVADFFDRLFIGECEESLPKFLRGFLEEQGEDKVNGVYHPGAKRQVRRQHFPGFSNSPAWSWVRLKEGEFAGMHLVEIGRGCRRRCHFCMLSAQAGKPRAAQLSAILNSIEPARGKLGRVGLIGSTALDENGLARVLTAVLEKGFKFSLDSLRLDLLSERVIGLLAKGGVRSVAVAPETGCEPLREKAGKKMSDAYIIGKAALLAKAGVSRLKLYFLLGLPDAEDEAAQIVALVKKLLAAMRGNAVRGRRVELVVVLNPFLAKAGTVWQRQAVRPLTAWRKDSSLVKKGLSRLSGVSVKAKASRNHLCQAILSRAGAEIAPAIAGSLEAGEPLADTMKTLGLAPDEYLAEREGDLPWGFIKQ